MRISTAQIRFPAIAAALLFLASCESHPLVLIPAPVIYRDGGLDPHGHLEPEEKTTKVRVFYCSSRSASRDGSAP